MSTKSYRPLAAARSIPGVHFQRAPKKPKFPKSICKALRKSLQAIEISTRAVLWFFFCPRRRKFATIAVTYKYGGIRLCWHRMRERFTREEPFINVLFRTIRNALRHFLRSSGRKIIRNVWVIYKAGGIRLCWYYAVEKFGSKQSLYEDGIGQNQLSYFQSAYLLGQLSNKPLLSIVVPVYKVEPKWLEKCISSVARQYYQNWELILVDDASLKNDLKRLMNTWASQDKRIRVYYLQKNLGIAGATNFGIKQARGEFIGFLDHDDELTPDALTWIVWAINKNPQASWFYSDEDKVSEEGRCHLPYYKPDFSPEFLLSNMYTCHFSVYSAKILNEVGGLRRGFEGSQDHDLALRLSETVHRENVIHIPRILYHWRELPGSTAKTIEAKPKAALAGIKAVAEALTRRNLKGKVSSHQVCPTLYQIELQPSEFPKVTIIIPTKNALSLLKKCIHSIREHTNYPNYEILIIDNESDDLRVKEYLAVKSSNNHLRVIQYNKPFNHSEINNIAVKSVDSEFVAFMNNDVEILSDNWLEQLVASVNIDQSIACVGTLLLYQNRTVQHAGIILGVIGIVGHAFKYVPFESGSYGGRLHCLQEMSGVTAALSLVRRSAFEALGGFNSDRYPTSYNDVDLCIRLRKRGFRCLYNPMVRAIHYESGTRPITPDVFDYEKKLWEDYAEILKNDPFYNPNLAIDNEQFSGFRPFPVEEQIAELRGIQQ